MKITDAAQDQIWEAIKKALIEIADVELASDIGWINKTDGRFVASAAMMAMRELED